MEFKVIRDGEGDKNIGLGFNVEGIDGLGRIDYFQSFESSPIGPSVTVTSQSGTLFGNSVLQALRAFAKTEGISVGFKDVEEGDQIYLHNINSFEHVEAIFGKLEELNVITEEQSHRLLAHVQQFEEDIQRERMGVAQGALNRIKIRKHRLPAGAVQELTRIKTARQSIHGPDSYTIEPNRFTGPGTGRSLA